MVNDKNKYRLPKAQRVMVFAPHMDDESIGCGGALLMYRQLNCELKIVFLTNGKQGCPEEIKALRQRESASAATLLGAEQLELYDLPDGLLSVTEELIMRICRHITAYQPDLIFTPNLNDLHRDHIVTAAAVTEALRRSGGGQIAYYEIWNPIPNPNCFINISEVVSQKLELIRCYNSQIKKYRLIPLILSLNAYRAAFFPLKKYRFVEAYLFQTIGTTEDGDHCQPQF